jgi:hypothetical protein
MMLPSDVSRIANRQSLSPMSLLAGADGTHRRRKAPTMGREVRGGSGSLLQRLLTGICQTHRYVILSTATRERRKVMHVPSLTPRRAGSGSGRYGIREAGQEGGAGGEAAR